MPKGKREGPPYTRRELMIVDTLNRVEKIPVAQLALRFNRNPKSLSVMLCHYRKGEVRFAYERYANRMDRILELFAQGKTRKEIAADLGITHAALGTYLWNHGFDRFEEAEIREYGNGAQ